MYTITIQVLCKMIKQLMQYPILNDMFISFTQQAQASVKLCCDERRPVFSPWYDELSYIRIYQHTWEYGSHKDVSA